MSTIHTSYQNKFSVLSPLILIRSAVVVYKYIKFNDSQMFALMYTKKNSTKIYVERFIFWEYMIYYAHNIWLCVCVRIYVSINDECNIRNGNGTAYTYTYEIPFTLFTLTNFFFYYLRTRRWLHKFQFFFFSLLFWCTKRDIYKMLLLVIKAVLRNGIQIHADGIGAII